MWQHHRLERSGDVDAGIALEVPLERGGECHAGGAAEDHRVAGAGYFEDVAPAVGGDQCQPELAGAARHHSADQGGRGANGRRGIDRLGPDRGRPDDERGEAGKGPMDVHSRSVVGIA